MINSLKEMLSDIVTLIEIGDHTETMQAIANFTLLFDEFLQQNKEYIFHQEMANLNRYLIQMVYCLEQNDLQGLKEAIDEAIIGFINNWDFSNNKNIN